MTGHRLVLAVAVLAAAFALLLASRSAGAAPPAKPDAATQPEAVRARIVESGCPGCHRDKPDADATGKPLAPSFHDIAQRYRGVPDAETRLTHVVIEGGNPRRRHWQDRADFASMGANAPHIKPHEAREFVRWILAQP